MSKEKELEKDIFSFKEKVKRDAEQLVLTKFPQKIFDLEALLSSQKFNPNLKLTESDINIPVAHSSSNAKINREQLKKLKSFTKQTTENEIDGEDQPKPFLFPNGAVECNKHLIQFIEILKPRMVQLMEDIISVKFGINLMIPKIEDGNNFGVQIQQQTIEAISGVEEDVQNGFDSFSNYFQTRGDLIAKVAKYPQAEDFRRAVQERDQKFHLNLCMILTDIRNHYAGLHDLVTKNLNKIKKPRSTNDKQFLY